MNALDNHFKKHLEGLEIAPSANLWQQKIAGNLASAPTKSFAIWYRAAAVIILFLGSWFAVSYFGNGQKIVQPNVPIANQPTDLPTRQIETVAPIISPEAAMPKTSAKEKGVATANKTVKTPTRKAIEKEGIPVQIAQELKTSAVPVVGESQVKVKISIANQAKYLQPETTEIAANTITETPSTIKDYALAQFKNLAKREKLEAPPKDWFEIPQLAVRVEGNPLKKVLLPN